MPSRLINNKVMSVFYFIGNNACAVMEKLVGEARSKVSGHFGMEDSN